MFMQPSKERIIAPRLTMATVMKQENVAHQSVLPMVAEPQNDVEQQLTALMYVQSGEIAQQARKASVVEHQEEVEQQPTQAIVMGQDEVAEQPTLAMVIKQHIHAKRMERWFVPALLCLVLLSGTVVGVAALHIRIPIFSAIHKILIPSTHPHNPQTVLSGASNLSSQFMDAMMHKDWAVMWSMLHPDAQKSWQGETDFIHFEQAKFGSMKFMSYTASTASIQQPWLDPDTTQVYPSAALMDISLVANAPKGLLSTPSNLALNQGLFKNTLFALARVKGVWKVLVAGPADLEAPILVPASPPVVKVLVPIFMYHHISNKPTHNALDYSLTVTTTDFNQQLNWLSQHGFQSIDQTELFDALYYGKLLPPHPMILTFDDGYEDAYTDALPALQAHHYRAVFYIITGMIGGNYMTWGQVHQLFLDGMQISSHTVHHVNIGQPPPPTTTQEELTVSKKTLEALLGQPVQFFCYPTGEPFHLDTVAEQQIVLKDLFDDGYVSATLDPFSVFSAIQDAQMPYQLNRLRVSGGETLDAYIGILNYTLDSGTRLLQVSSASH